MEMSLSSLLSSQEFPAPCDVLLNCLPLAPLIRLQAVLLQRLKRYLWVGVVPLPKAELFFPPLLFDSTPYGPALRPLHGALPWARGTPVSQSRARPVKRTAEPWPSLLLEEDRCKDILS